MFLCLEALTIIHKPGISHKAPLVSTSDVSQVPTTTSGFYEASLNSWDVSNEFE